MVLILIKIERRDFFLDRLINIFILFFIDISTDEFPANYFDRHAIYFKNHDMNNNPLRK